MEVRRRGGKGASTTQRVRPACRVGHHAAPLKRLAGSLPRREGRCSPVAFATGGVSDDLGREVDFNGAERGGRRVTAHSPRNIQGRIARSQSVGSCLEIVEVYSTFLDDVHVSSLYNKVADLRRGRKGGGVGREALEHLSELVKLRLPSMNTRSLSTVANACGKMGNFEGWCVDDAVCILGHVRARVNASLGDFTAVDIENVLWAHGKLGIRLHPEELDSWYCRLSETVGDLPVKSVVSLLYTCQRQRYRPPPAVMSALGRAAEALVPEMSLKCLTNVLSSLAHLQSDEMQDSVFAVTASISRELEKSGGRSSMNLRNAANVLWSFAELQYYPPDKVLRLLDGKVLALLQSERGGAFVLNTYLRACHKLARKPHEGILEASLAVISEGFLAGSGRDVLRQTCRLIKSLIMLNFEVPVAYLTSLEKSLVATEGALDHVTVHDSLWAFATSGYSIGGEYESRATRYVEDHAFDGLKRGALCRMIWSMTILRVPLKDSSLLDGIAACLSEDANWVSHSFGLLLWAMRDQGCEVDPAALRRAKAHTSMNWDSMTPTEILYSMDVLSSVDLVDASDGAWLTPALQRARTFVIR
ncbi:hypothetical protein HOP50_04g34070 [Chloropicon primus]|uniref:FAST kinase leucine-rich domain-containing protein n=1 Tax=Chloropicon primus TaxID=1764295 RepID=A0A5B8MNH9_9CHLO|nr:hypothetical protein A3770_04p33980 [Chloropicon primus]UPR00093.1 hypothetical protein HOP50_04g34070 [Chloropicon primus]|eukprot:QDZ20880.1 hypothetical protein A3770_04p33980 [Chloropicon primus]